MSDKPELKPEETLGWEADCVRCGKVEDIHLVKSLCAACAEADLKRIAQDATTDQRRRVHEQSLIEAIRHETHMVLQEEKIREHLEGAHPELSTAAGVGAAGDGEAPPGC